ncbi:MAG: O-antigen ligase family protein [Patescibacteria group bacterium]
MKQWFQKIERFFLLFFLAAIPFQARIILYSSSWYFNEYVSFALYGTDLLLAVILILWLWQKRGSFAWPTWSSVALTLFVLVAGLSLIGLLKPEIGWYRFGKLTEGVLLYFYMRHRSFEVASPAAMLMAVGLGGVFQAGLGIVQFIRQADINLQYLGESVLRPDMRGVAVFYNEAGEKIMRAYGTTPHPNILATYLFLGLGSLYILYVRYKKRVNDRIWHVTYAIILFGFFATFSRTIIFAWVLLVSAGIIFWLGRYRGDLEKLWRMALTTVAVGGLFAVLFWGDIVGRLTIAPTDETIVLRQYYNSQALHSHQKISLGLGIGNFVPWLMKYRPGLPRELYQPAHNIYLLIYAELGILGIAAFISWLALIIISFFRAAKFDLERLFIAGMFVSLIFIGVFDHFFWTLQQGILMWWGIAGLVAHYGKSR